MTTTYRQAAALAVLLEEVNVLAPNRSTASDGWIGDPSHQARASDHNPNADGVVRARDFTHDPAGGLDCHRFARHLAGLMVARHPALVEGAYIIWDRRILSAARIREGWRAYHGPNPHTRHLHLSVAAHPAGYDNRTRWGLTTTTSEEEHMEQVLKDILAELRAQTRIMQAMGQADLRRESVERREEARDIRRDQAEEEGK